MKMETSIKPCVCEQLKDTNEWELVVGVGNDRSSIAVGINYCPFCGRKLTEE